ncbi:unnamed protein product [Durusdinium trenchii]|uniref:Uncharacterized protein n=2 Tax=Durusdinium trenchii TaxID=1381693 RepID=A0ABP0SHV8_9DINO
MHGADYAAEAAERVKVIQAEAEELLSEINRETEIKRQQIEDEQLELQSGHAAKIQELQLEIRAVRDDADERIHKIEQEMLVHQSSIEDEVLQKSAERSEALKAIREEAHEMSSLADEEYQKSLDQEVEAHERARKEMMDLEDERSRKVEEIEQSCQLWITAFNQRLEQTQADLASRVEHLVGEARAARLRLHQDRQLRDQQWEEELFRLRQEALKERFEAASSLDSARLKRKELEDIAREKSLEGTEECQKVRQKHIAVLRKIADELDNIRRNIGLQARDPMLVQSLKELAVKIRQGQMKQPPPRIQEMT